MEISNIEINLDNHIHGDSMQQMHHCLTKLGTISNAKQAQLADVL